MNGTSAFPQEALSAPATILKRSIVCHSAEHSQQDLPCLSSFDTVDDFNAATVYYWLCDCLWSLAKRTQVKWLCISAISQLVRHKRSKTRLSGLNCGGKKWKHVQRASMSICGDTDFSLIHHPKPFIWLGLQHFRHTVSTSDIRTQMRAISSISGTLTLFCICTKHYFVVALCIAKIWA